MAEPIWGPSGDDHLVWRDARVLLVRRPIGPPAGAGDGAAVAAGVVAVRRRTPAPAPPTPGLLAAGHGRFAVGAAQGIPLNFRRCRAETVRRGVDVQVRAEHLLCLWS